MVSIPVPAFRLKMCELFHSTSLDHFNLYVLYNIARVYLNQVYLHILVTRQPHICSDGKNPCSKVLQKIIISPLFKKFPVFYENWFFKAMLT